MTANAIICDHCGKAERLVDVEEEYGWFTVDYPHGDTPAYAHGPYKDLRFCRLKCLTDWAKWEYEALNAYLGDAYLDDRLVAA